MDNFEHFPHPHTKNRKQANQEPSQGKNLNRKLGLWVIKHVGSMWAAYLFAALALISLPATLATGDVRVIVDWLTQTFLQLVLVSAVLVGQNQMNREAENRAEATFNDATAILHEVEQLQKHMAQQDVERAQLRHLLGGKLGNSSK